MGPEEIAQMETVIETWKPTLQLVTDKYLQSKRDVGCGVDLGKYLLAFNLTILNQSILIQHNSGTHAGIV